jgi:hypothetical protein
MNSDEYLVFLEGLLVKLENSINLIDQEPGKHIPAYHKILGVQQKLAGLEDSYKNKLFPQIVKVRGVINYLTNGRYDEAYSQMMRIKNELVKICLEIKNANNTVTKV